jgi:hypothetical protein
VADKPNKQGGCFSVRGPSHVRPDFGMVGKLLGPAHNIAAIPSFFKERPAPGPGRLHKPISRAAEVFISFYVSFARAVVTRSIFRRK